MIYAKNAYLTEAEAVNRYGYSRSWFQRERWKGTGPEFIKSERGKIFYPIKETDAWFCEFGFRGIKNPSSLTLDLDDFLIILKCVKIAKKQNGDHPDIDNVEWKVQVMIESWIGGL